MANPTIYINPVSGSIKILGSVDFVDAEGNILETKENIKFCGCSLSKDKPWCDGSHREITGQNLSTNSQGIPFGANLRAITFFESDLMHNNVVSGLQGDSSFYQVGAD